MLYTWLLSSKDWKIKILYLLFLVLPQYEFNLTTILLQ